MLLIFVGHNIKTKVPFGPLVLKKQIKDYANGIIFVHIGRWYIDDELLMQCLIQINYAINMRF